MVRTRVTIHGNKCIFTKVSVIFFILNRKHFQKSINLTNVNHFVVNNIIYFSASDLLILLKFLTSFLTPLRCIFGFEN